MTETSATSSGNYVITEHGIDTITTIETMDTLNGSYTQTETGNDGYTLTETGTLASGAYSETITGNDTISQQEIGNTIQGTYTRTLSGGGSYSLSETGGTMTTGSGSSSYSLTESANVLTGAFSISETGRDRYGFLQQFDNVADTDGVNTPGHMNYNPFGDVFVDDSKAYKVPGADEIKNQPHQEPGKDGRKYYTPEEFQKFMTGMKPFPTKKIVDVLKPLLNDNGTFDLVKVKAALLALDPQIIDGWRMQMGCIGLCSIYQQSSKDWIESVCNSMEQKQKQDKVQNPNEISAELLKAAMALASAAEETPKVRCYLTLDDALKQNQGQLGKNEILFVFVKQGQWATEKAPKPDATNKTIPSGSISDDGDDFNYVVYFPATKTYMWMNQNAKIGNQKVYLSDTLPAYPNTWPNNMVGVLKIKKP